MSNVRSSEEATAVTDERAELIDCLRYRPVATTAAQMREAADLLERDEARKALAEAREALARWLIAHGFSTGHGDTLDDLLGELSWQVKERSAEAEALRKEAARMRGALEMLYPGLVLDLRYADADDDRDALQSRIDTVEEALSPSTIDAAIAKEQSHASE